MHFKFILCSVFLSVLVLFTLPTAIYAISVNEMIDQYPVITQATKSTTYINKIRSNISFLVQDGTHRPYPGGMYGEDMNKILFWKGQEVATLAETIPYLDTNTAASLKSFLSYEVQNYLLNQNYQNWMIQGNINTQLPQVNLSFWQWASVDMESLYGLWAYAHYTNDWNTISSNWNFITNILNSFTSKGSKKFTGNNNYHRAPNSEIAGRIAYARMAKKLYQMTGNSSYQTAYQAQVTKLSSTSSSIISPIIGLNQFSSQVCDFDATSLCNPAAMSDRDIMPHLSQFDMLTPEIGRYLQTNFLSQSQTVIQNIESQIPWWFLGGYNLYRIGTGEGYFQPPVLSNQIFQAKALILNTPTNELEYKLPNASAFASLPYYADALNYHNLLSLIEREETVTWTDSNTPHPTIILNGTTPLPSATPIPKLGDANGDNQINGVDYIIWLNNYGSATTQKQSKGDFNGDGNVNGADYIIWLNNYGS